MTLALLFQGLAIDYIIWGVAVAGVAQLAFVFVSAWRVGLRVSLSRPRWTSDVRGLSILALPGILAAGIGQINLLIGTSIATGQQGAAAWLFYADRLYQLPMGVIGVALSVALLPDLARSLAAKDEARARQSQNNAVLSASGLTLPAAIGLFVLATPLVQLLFERGAFTASDTSATAQAVQAFCLGLPAFVLVKALQPSFFARKDTRTPLIDGAIGVAVNITISLSLFPIYGFIAIAYATSLAGWVTLILMLVRLSSRAIWSLDGAVTRQLLAQLAASLLMGAGLLSAVFFLPPPDALLMLFVWVMSMVVGGAALFGALALGFGGITRAQLRRLRGRV